MSNNTVENKDNDGNPLQEVKKNVAITPEDCNGAGDFWTHFEVPMTPELKEAFGAFNKDPSFANQEAIKYQICKAIGYSEHEAFKDDMFKEIVEECKNVAYDMGFDNSLETVLDSKDDTK